MDQKDPPNEIIRNKYICSGIRYAGNNTGMMPGCIQTGSHNVQLVLDWVVDVKKIIRKGFYKYISLKRTIKENTSSLKNKIGEVVTTDMKAVCGTISPPSVAESLGAPMNALSSPQGSQARLVGDFTASIRTSGQCRGKNSL